MQSLRVALLLLLGCFSAVSAQNCGITGVNGSVINVNSVNETTPGDVLIWTRETYNVVSAGSVNSPQTKYIKGLRYVAKYEYLTETIFPEFVQTERTQELRRDVVFSCADGQSVSYTFVLPVLDENTERPVFSRQNYTATMVQSSNSTEPINANIIVTDLDVDYKNANILIRSSNAQVTPLVRPMWEGSNPDPFIYQVDLVINKALTAGVYEIILTCDDGKYSDYAFLTLTIQ